MRELVLVLQLLRMDDGRGRKQTFRIRKTLPNAQSPPPNVGVCVGRSLVTGAPAEARTLTSWNTWRYNSRTGQDWTGRRRTAGGDGCRSEDTTRHESSRAGPERSPEMCSAARAAGLVDGLLGTDSPWFDHLKSKSRARLTAGTYRDTSRSTGASMRGRQAETDAEFLLYGTSSVH